MLFFIDGLYMDLTNVVVVGSQHDVVRFGTLMQIDDLLRQLSLWLNNIDSGAMPSPFVSLLKANLPSSSGKTELDVNRHFVFVKNTEGEIGRTITITLNTGMVLTGLKQLTTLTDLEQSVLIYCDKNNCFDLAYHSFPLTMNEAQIIFPDVVSFWRGELCYGAALASMARRSHKNTSSNLGLQHDMLKHLDSAVVMKSVTKSLAQLDLSSVQTIGALKTWARNVAGCNFNTGIHLLEVVGHSQYTSLTDDDLNRMHDNRTIQLINKSGNKLLCCFIE